MSAALNIRPAQAADAPAITAVHCSNVTHWQIWDSGIARPARYADLTAYQRWLHGGAWFDPDTCAQHLERLFKGGGYALVAEVQGRVLAEAEFFVAEEPPPYGRNLNLSILYVHRNYHGQGLGSALLRAARALAEREGCETFLVANAEAPEFYRRQRLRLAERWRRDLVPVRTTTARYTAEPLADADYELVRGWALPIGRYQNAHHDWERTRPGAVPDFEEWRGLKGERYTLTTGRQRAIVAFEEGQPGLANTFLFTPPDGKGYTPMLFAAVRDLAARCGFKQLHCLVRSDLKLPGAIKTDYVHQLFKLQLKK